MRAKRAWQKKPNGWMLLCLLQKVFESFAVFLRDAPPWGTCVGLSPHKKRNCSLSPPVGFDLGMDGWEARMLPVCWASPVRCATVFEPRTPSVDCVRRTVNSDCWQLFIESSENSCFISSFILFATKLNNSRQNKIIPLNIFIQFSYFEASPWTLRS